MNRAFALILPLALVTAWKAPFLAASAAPTAAKKAAPAPQTSTMEISARKTEYDGQKHVYTVTGNVRITLEDLLVTCQQATIFATADESRVERVLFSGDVIAKRGPHVFTGETVSFHLQTRRLLAEGGTTTKLQVPASTPSAR
jgi:lipopolysaccharide export system protein LptA